ncbi:hypothetical protein KAFR_0B04140 [Kazachstania africana CBS 2517]|uniref:Small ribosomal subunit protein mS33 n=1 Tax=Kazachstania africana (strain ATCC 22294 / BCRC 22015 / CBS 2517 / CECT 1963 / NBRC 1671 / NRRL Y-8276) TaxID=1071382 RepID=H2AQR0_KAZAF|nr:hypothetical protein KAFR_0B04140 [Kazachstania africana CBS 2517]CCF56710.1 hypothetical protein KAFR_0B04140 [Kazachstania africana CBS 2517]
MSVPKKRLFELNRLSAKIFDQNFNPQGLRTGSKILSSRLKGPTIANYYGNPDFLKFKNLKTLFPNYQFVDTDELYRLSKVEGLKRRGKGPPKKTKSGSTLSKPTKHK